MTKIIINLRDNLSFEADDLNSPRRNIKYTNVAPSPLLQKWSKDVVKKCLDLLPIEFQPNQIEIALEKNAHISTIGVKNEYIPMSLITSFQRPRESLIQIGLMEIENDELAFKSVLAHEMGHMLIEWPSRKMGFTAEQDALVTHWCKSIYEGIADWIGYNITASNYIGSPNIWFKRKLGEFQDLESVQNNIGNIVEEIFTGLTSAELIPKYAAYQEWADLIKLQYTDKIDPYAEGSYLAWKLQLKSQTIGFSNLFKNILHELLSSRGHQELQSFMTKLDLPM